MAWLAIMVNWDCHSQSQGAYLAPMHSPTDFFITFQDKAPAITSPGQRPFLVHCASDEVPSWACICVVQSRYLCLLFHGTLLSCTVMVPSPQGQGGGVLSAAAWLQISLLCGHTQSVAVRACQNFAQVPLLHTP